MFNFIFKPRLNIFDIAVLSIAIPLAQTGHWGFWAAVMIPGILISAACERHIEKN